MLLSQKDSLAESDERAAPESTNVYRDTGIVPAARQADRAMGAAHSARNESKVYSPLTGAYMENFTHNNVEPFYRGDAPCALRDREPATVPDPKREKLETRGWDRDQVGTKQRDLGVEEARLTASLSNLRTGELLMQPMREHAVAPESLARVLPPTVDDLRILSKPRIVDEGRVIPGKAVTEMRAQVPCVPKRTPDSFKATGFEDFLPNTGPASKANTRPQELLHATARGINRTDWVSPAGYAQWGVMDKQAERDPRALMPPLPGGGAAKAGAWDASRDMSANQFSEILRDNERNLSPALPMTGIVAGPGPSYVTSDDQEQREWNKKTITTGAQRVFGHMRGTTALKGEIHDPNMTMRTTLKETLIHDTSIGMLGPSTLRTEAREPDAQAPLTIRNTLCDVDNNVNVAPGFTKPLVYDPDDIFDPTHRDTLGQERTGNVARDMLQSGLGYETNQVEAPNTNKQFNMREYFGQADTQDGDGYKVAMTDGMYPTIRAETGDKGVSLGSAGTTGAKKTMSYADIYSRSIRDTKERILKGRAPTTVGPRLTKGSQDPDLYLECNRDPVMSANVRYAGNVDRQGAVQNHVESSTCQDGRGTNSLPIENRRFDKAEIVALRTNPYVQDISKPPRGGVAFKM